jgi:hypothetical protein
MKGLKVYMSLVGLMMCLCIMGQQPPQRVPAIRTPIKHVQPDGDTLIVLLRGDERYHWMMTEDGYLIRENGNGVICYLQKDKRETAIVSKRQAHNADKRKCCERRWLKRKGITKTR